MRFVVRESKLLRNEFYVIDATSGDAVEVAGSERVAQERADAFNSGREAPLEVESKHGD